MRFYANLMIEPLLHHNSILTVFIELYVFTESCVPWNSTKILLKSIFYRMKKNQSKYMLNKF